MKIEQVGDVSIWWIERPRGARVGPRAALAAGLVIAGLLALALLWVRVREERLWPWSTVTPFVPSAPQYMLRYAYVLFGGFLFVVLASAPAWRRLRDTIRHDLRTVEQCIESCDWPSAALHIHRGALLRAELESFRAKRGDPELGRLDALVAPRLPAARRLVVYYRLNPPALPDAPEAGFQPRVVPISAAGGWWTAAVVSIVGVAALGHLTGALATRDWRVLLNINFLVEAAVLLGYLYVGLGGLLGRRRYFRFSPGVAELLHFKLRTAATETESISLRRCDVFLDVTGPGAMLALLDRTSGRRVAEYELGRSAEVVETCLRAVLSTAPEHPLPRHELTA